MSRHDPDRCTRDDCHRCRAFWSSLQGDLEELEATDPAVAAAADAYDAMVEDLTGRVVQRPSSRYPTTDTEETTR